MRILVLAMLICTLVACEDRAPDILYFNGVVWTGVSGEPTAQAFGITAGRISSVGSDRELRAAAGSNTIEIDLEGRFVVPGFIDNHVHFLSGGFQLASVDLRDADSPTEFAVRIARFAESLDAGRWIQGGDWDHELWGGALPERDWIDSVASDHPVFVTRLDGHMGLANTVALRLSGIDETTPDPPGGSIVRRPDGQPTGVLKDEAMGLVFSMIPSPDSVALDLALERAMRHAAEHGVTQVHDVGSFGGWTDLEVYRRAHSRQDLTLRIYAFVPLATWQRLRGFVEESGRGDEWLRWGGLKGFVDGSLGSTTAWFYEPYVDEPETSGLLVSDTAAIRHQVVEAAEAGLHLAVHAIGDRANDWLLDVYEEASRGRPKGDLRMRIEHAQHLSATAAARFATLGVIPSMQPYHAIDDGRWAEKRIGADRIERTYAFRSLLDAGARLTFGSDWTVAPISPLEGIYAAVTRRTIDGANPDGWVPTQKISVEEALSAYTKSNAYAGFQEGLLGTIEVGKLADLVVLSDNLLSIDPVRIPDVRVLRTIVGGKEVYRGEDRP